MTEPTSRSLAELESLRATVDAVWVALAPTGHVPDGSMRLPEIIRALMEERKALAETAATMVAFVRSELAHAQTLRTAKAARLDAAMPPADPCPQCIPGAVCNRATCGRRASAEVLALYGVPRQ